MTRLGVLFLLCIAVVAGRDGIGPGDQDWGYYEVRPGAHMFYWLYHTMASSERPLVIWLQGGPGASSTGYGNFEEMGVVDVYLKERNTSWVKEVNVLFIDNPVGTGFSYVKSTSLLTKNNKEIATDLVNFTRQFINEYPEFRTTPLYIFSESYGGKMAAEFGLYLQKDIEAGNVQVNLKGVGLGDSWISPIDSVLTWAPFLLYTGVVDYEGARNIHESAQKTQKAVESQQWSQATDLWGETEFVISEETYGVDFYNILYKVSSYRRQSKPADMLRYLYERHVLRDDDAALDALMNGPVKEKLGIPSGVTWGGQSGAVFASLGEDFMKPVTDIVERLLNETSLDVVVFSGQLDLIVDTPGTVDWVQRLQWSGADGWRKGSRDPLTVNGVVEGYVKRNGHLTFYWINRAGHMVPTDNPNAGLEMLRQVTHYK
ncbi:retinoid-inducible serine carboxypeptidase [Anabrus simplex]|uniref:retinoid-inducible serine carboxypeptidase n=1 Tax=Anabrus simplex TaxID=316456 RepID=UPI0034DD8FEB